MAVQQPALAAEAHGPALCPNCSTEFLGDYCHHCGEHSHHTEELTLRHFVLHITHDLTHLDAKIFTTLRYLFARPGFLTQEFIAGKRVRYMRPFSLFLLACAIFFLADSIWPVSGYDIHHLTATDRTGKIDEAWQKLANAKHVPKEIIVERVQETMHRASTAAQIFNALAMAIMLAMLFHKHYFVEHLVFSLHFLSLTYLASVLLLPFRLNSGLMNTRNIYVFLAITLIFMVYLFIGMRNVYKQGAVATLLKAIIAYTVTQLVIVATLITALVVSVVRAAMAH